MYAQPFFKTVVVPNGKFTSKFKILLFYIFAKALIVLKLSEVRCDIDTFQITFFAFSFIFFALSCINSVITKEFSSKFTILHFGSVFLFFLQFSDLLQTQMYVSGIIILFV